LWVVGVAGGSSSLAGLNGELGTVLQVLVGGTAAEFGSALWSGTDGTIGTGGWEGAVSTGS